MTEHYRVSEKDNVINITADVPPSLLASPLSENRTDNLPEFKQCTDHCHCEVHKCLSTAVWYRTPCATVSTVLGITLIGVYVYESSFPGTEVCIFAFIFESH